jgi:hypothetical protein
MIIVFGHAGRHVGTVEGLAALAGTDGETFRGWAAWLDPSTVPGTDPRRLADIVERSLGTGDCVVVLGRRAARSFGLRWEDVPPGTIARHGNGAVLLLPHPTVGHNLNAEDWWGDPSHRQRAEEAMRTVWGGYRL